MSMQSQEQAQESAPQSNPSTVDSSPTQRPELEPEQLTTESSKSPLSKLEAELRQRGQWIEKGPNTGGVIITGTIQAQAHLKRYKEQQALTKKQ